MVATMVGAERWSSGLAAVLGGRAVRWSDAEWTVDFVPLKGCRWARLEPDAGTVYAHGVRDAADLEIVGGADWGRWDGSEVWACGLAEVIGGEARQTGGNTWVVVLDRPDGRQVWIGEESAAIYADAECDPESAEHYEWA